jgi:hypothetical protein
MDRLAASVEPNGGKSGQAKGDLAKQEGGDDPEADRDGPEQDLLATRQWRVASLIGLQVGERCGWL